MRLVFLIALIIAVGTNSAYAYIDPGSGSFFLQIIIAGLVAGLFIIKTLWIKIKNFFVVFFKKKENDKK